MSWSYDLLRSAWSIEQTAYPLPHCQQGEVAGIIIFCLAYQFMLLSLTNPEKVVTLVNAADLKRVANLKNISDLKKTVACLWQICQF